MTKKFSTPLIQTSFDTLSATYSVIIDGSLILTTPPLSLLVLCFNSIQSHKLMRESYNESYTYYIIAIPWGQLCIIIAYLPQKLRTVNLHCVLQFETNLLKWI